MKIVTAIAAVALAVGLAGCVPEESTSPETITDPTPTPTPTSSLSHDEEIYVDVVRSEVSGLNGSDRDLINLGEAVCESFDEGLGFLSVASAISEGSGLSDYDSGFIIGASIPAFCPEHMDKIEIEEDYY